jgi:hypothetical protein
MASIFSELGKAAAYMLPPSKVRKQHSRSQRVQGTDAIRKAVSSDDSSGNSNTPYRVGRKVNTKSNDKSNDES